MLKLVSSLALTAALLFQPAMASAQDKPYPSDTVHIVIAFGPGTAGDFLARLAADQLSKQTNGAFVVDNRPGGSGSTGTKAVAVAAPDGYTLLLGSNATLIINPIVKNVKDYDPEVDFATIGTIAQTGMVLVTAAKEGSPKTLTELLDKAKAGSVAFASAGAGTFGHLTTEVLLENRNIKARGIPYKSSSESLTDVMRGEVLFAHDTVAAALPMIKSGQLKALAVTGEKRLASLPDVPTYKEAGIDGMNITVWYGLMAPAKTPAPVLEKLHTELAAMMKDPKVLERLKSQEFEPILLSGADYTKFFRQDAAFWKKFTAAGK
ncbi:Bug family tripartite tricarboxylate transporter substrate binding protein [Sinorhizobium meliloti]|nr:tripartite tricarboxylate transporter substrate binding protein [Sinorhizobium meliloti]